MPESKFTEVRIVGYPNFGVCRKLVGSQASREEASSNLTPLWRIVSLTPERRARRAGRENPPVGSALGICMPAFPRMIENINGEHWNSFSETKTPLPCCHLLSHPRGTIGSCCYMLFVIKYENFTFIFGIRDPKFGVKGQEI